MNFGLVIESKRCVLMELRLIGNLY